VSRYADELARQPGALASVLGDNDRALAAARDALTSAERIRLAGVGSSRHAAGFGAAVIDLVAGRPAAVLDAPGSAVPVPAHRAGDLLVVVSQSGRTPALVRLAMSARATGATVVAVVNDASGPLAAGADVVLRCGAGFESVIPATGSVTTAMLLLRALAGPVAAPALDELVQASTTILGTRWVMSAVPQRVVAGGLAGEWVAEEVALKLAEVAAVLATAESVVDHLHGPVALTVPTLALLEPSDANAATVAAPAAVITAGPASTYTHPLPAVTDPTLAPIARVIAGQRAALAVAELVGVDPDHPRGLHKVTMTS
jgi:glucosamine--fructose-6-phosphate aminotransferase (isomerizing)